MVRERGGWVEERGHEQHERIGVQGQRPFGRTEYDSIDGMMDDKCIRGLQIL